MASLTFKGRYSDGKTSKMHEVTVRMDGKTIELTFADLASVIWPVADLKVCHDWVKNLGGTFEHKREYGATLSLTDKDMFDSICKAMRERDRATYLVSTNPVTLLALLVLAVGIVIIIFPLVSRLSENIAYIIPKSVEKKISNIALQSIGDEFQECKDEDAHKALTKLVAELMRAQKGERSALSEMPELHIYNTSMVNAFALPGDHMAVLTGFLKGSKNEDEVAGVLAHEMGHIYNKDPMKYLVQSQEFRIIASMMGSSGYGEIASVATALSTLQYSREKERAADEFAKRILPKAGYTTKGLSSFLERAEKRSPEMIQTIQKNLSFLSTHPETAERIRNLDSGAQNKEPVSILTGSEWRALQSACRGSKK